MSLDADDFEFVRRLVKTHSGMVLEEGKEYLVETRLTPVAKLAGFGSLSDMLVHLSDRPMSELHVKVVEALMTNETQFFRDSHPFDALNEGIIPKLRDQRAGDHQLNLWCAAASTGQEPYSLMMLLNDSFPDLAHWRVRCIASDIAEDVLERARLGRYSQVEIVRGLPESTRDRYFHRRGNQWEINEQIRRQVEFRKINLVDDWPALPPMDLILMRNVLIYFDVTTKKRILNKVRRVLRPDGFLLLGSAETTINLDNQFDRVPIEKTICYQIRS